MKLFWRVLSSIFCILLFIGLLVDWSVHVVCDTVQLMMDYLDWCPDLKNVFPLVFSHCECVMSHKRSAAVVTEKLWEVAADGQFDAGGFPSLRSFLIAFVCQFHFFPWILLHLLSLFHNLFLLVALLYFPSFLPLSLSFLLRFSCVLLSALITSLLPYHPYLLILFLVLVSIPLVCFFISSLCFFLIFPFPHFLHFILIYILLNIFVSLFPLFRNV